MKKGKVKDNITAKSGVLEVFWIWRSTDGGLGRGYTLPIGWGMGSAQNFDFKPENGAVVHSLLHAGVQPTLDPSAETWPHVGVMH